MWFRLTADTRDDLAGVRFDNAFSSPFAMASKTGGQAVRSISYGTQTISAREPLPAKAVAVTPTE